jgi:hypothetical protein
LDGGLFKGASNSKEGFLCYTGTFETHKEQNAGKEVQRLFTGAAGNKDQVCNWVEFDFVRT